MLDATPERYRAFQKDFYERIMSPGTDEAARDVVGHYLDHEAYPYEAYLLAKLDHPEKKIALDFGCGPGRMILRMAPLMKRVDGCDISGKIIEVARRWTERLSPRPLLYETNGAELNGIPSDIYDFVYCTVSFQHIASYEIRMLLLHEFARVLKKGGQIALQMIISPVDGHPENGVLWRESGNDATSTNGTYDVWLTPSTLLDLADDLLLCGFDDVSFDIQPPPHEWPADWLFVYARCATI